MLPDTLDVIKTKLLCNLLIIDCVIRISFHGIKLCYNKYGVQKPHHIYVYVYVCRRRTRWIKETKREKERKKNYTHLPVKWNKNKQLKYLRFKIAGEKG